MIDGVEYVFVAGEVESNLTPRPLYTESHPNYYNILLDDPSPVDSPSPPPKPKPPRPKPHQRTNPCPLPNFTLSEEQRRALTLVRPKQCPNRQWTLALAQPTHSRARRFKQPSGAKRTVRIAGKHHPTRNGTWRSPRRLPRERQRQFGGMCYSPRELHEMKQLNR